MNEISSIKKIESIESIVKFNPFEIEFSQPRFLKIKCIKHLRRIEENSFNAYLGIELSSNELFNVYEWRISLEKNKIFDQKRLETCEIEMTKLEDEYKRILRLNSKSLMKYVAYKYYKETNKNFFIIQVILKILKY